MTTSPAEQAALPDGYYAVPDPDAPALMTLWHVKGGNPKARPPKGLRYGPQALRKDIPGRPGEDEYIAWMRNHFGTVADWHRRVREALAVNPQAAMRAYAALTNHCCNCGRPLTGGTSKALGVGPDCRERMPHELLMAYLAEVKRARSTTTTEGTDPR
jgi:hypothetical protein